MTLRDIINNTQRFASNNSPAILTAVGVTGTVTTAWLAGVASFKAAQILEDEKVAKSVRLTSQDDNHFDLTAREKFELLWVLYVPAVATGVGTVACIIMANRVQGRRAAAMAAAYSLSERAFTEYKEKVVEKLGEHKERAVRDELAQERVKNHPPKDGFVIITDSDKVLCHDAFSNQYFHSDMETIRKAVNDVNAQVLHNDSATVTDFYNFIDSPELNPTDISSEMGWNTDKLLECDYTTVLYKDRIPCLSVSFARAPMPNPWRYV